MFKLMMTLISKDSLIVDKLADALSESTGDLLERDFKAIACEFLAEDRAIEQIELFVSEISKFEKIDFNNKKLLEIGAGVGTFLVTARTRYQIDAFGVEPSQDEFSPFNEISLALLREYNLPKDIVISASAEKLPFSDNSFDFIYSTNVLEHVQNPGLVIKESVRVLKAGGYLQFVIPNYFSFWEGHYGILWPCLTNRFLAKVYALLVGKNPKYIDTLQLISPFYLKRILTKMENVQILSWGKDVFKKRLTTGNYSDWASLQKIRPIVSLVQKLKISSFLADVLNMFEMYTPIVLTAKKTGN